MKLTLRNFSIGLISILSGFTAYIYITPYISLYSIKTALDNGDIKRANKFINYKSVRESLEDQVEQEAMKRILASSDVGSLSDLQLLLMKPVVKALSKVIVESTVNPNGLNFLIKTGKFTEKKENQPGKSNLVIRNAIQKGQDPNSIQTKAKIEPEQKQIKLFYSDLNTFTLISQVGEKSKKVVALWKRDGLTLWKLNSIKLENF